MLARLVPSLTGRPFTSLAASRSPTASGRATMCSTTRTRAKNTTPSFGRWLTNGFASCISAGKSAPRTTRTYTWKYSKNGAQFSPPCTCKQNDKNYGREGSGDSPQAAGATPGRGLGTGAPGGGVGIAQGEGPQGRGGRKGGRASPTGHERVGHGAEHQSQVGLPLSRSPPPCYNPCSCMADARIEELKTLLPQCLLHDWVRLARRLARLLRDRHHPDQRDALLER